MWDSWYRRESSFSSVGFSLFSSPFTSRDSNQSRDRPPLKSLPGYFRNCPSALQIFSRIFLETLRPPLKSFQDKFLDTFLKIIFPFLFIMSPLSNSAKTTFIYLSVSVGINLVLLLSSDPLTVIVGFACLVLSLCSLASFYLDQVMLDQDHI